MKILSQLITKASGSIGGLTASHAKGGGMYLRGRGNPINPNTARQTAVRAAMTELVTRWTEDLTPAQREAWALYASNVPTINPLGESILLSGQNWYIACNVARIQSEDPLYAPLDGLNAANPVIDDAPVIFDRGSFTAPSLNGISVATGVSVTISDADDWANETGSFALVYLSRPRNTSRIGAHVPYRLLGAFIGDDALPPAATQTFAMVDPTYVYASGQLGRIKTVVTRVDGRTSTAVESSDVVATA